ncbi:MAG: hypothetical protein AB9866_24080 [Syntrophobacteraceae bacterium]
MTDEEIRAYTAGYSTALREFRSILVNWVELKNAPHQNCQCAFCLLFREIAEGKYGGMGPLGRIEPD